MLIKETVINNMLIHSKILIISFSGPASDKQSSIRIIYIRGIAKGSEFL